MSNISNLLIQFEQNLAWPLLWFELAAILSGKNRTFINVFFEHNVDEYEKLDFNKNQIKLYQFISKSKGSVSIR